MAPGCTNRAGKVKEGTSFQTFHHTRHAATENAKALPIRDSEKTRSTAVERKRRASERAEKIAL